MTKTYPITGTACTTIDAPVGTVFEAISDVTRMGEWSPECVGGRWIDGATGPALGARFEGDNVASLGPVTLKRWSTTSEVVGFEPNELFEFVAEDHTNWRYEFEEHDGVTTVTERFSHPPYGGWQRIVYGVLASRRTAMTKGMQVTLDRVKEALER